MSKSRRSRVKTKKGMWIVVLVALVVSAGLFAGQSKLKAENATLAMEKQKIEANIESAEEKSQELDNKQSYVGTDEYVEEIAREKLGMVKGDEILIKPES